MSIVLFGGEKGGIGKTTLVTNMAANYPYNEMNQLYKEVYCGN